MNQYLHIMDLVSVRTNMEIAGKVIEQWQRTGCLSEIERAFLLDKLNDILRAVEAEGCISADAQDITSIEVASSDKAEVIHADKFVFSGMGESIPAADEVVPSGRVEAVFAAEAEAVPAGGAETIHADKAALAAGLVTSGDANKVTVVDGTKGIPAAEIKTVPRIGTLPESEPGAALDVKSLSEMYSHAAPAIEAVSDTIDITVSVEPELSVSASAYNASGSSSVMLSTPENSVRSKFSEPLSDESAEFSTKREIFSGESTASPEISRRGKLDKSAIRSLYDDRQAKKVVLGEVINNGGRRVGETLTPQVKAKIKAEKITDLRKALGLNDRYLITRDLFDGDPDAFSQAVEQLNAFTDLNDAMLFIHDNYRWDSNSAAAKLLVDLIVRKLI